MRCLAHARAKEKRAMSSARPFTSTPEADLPSAASSAATHASRSNGVRIERSRDHDEGAKSSVSPGKLGHVVASQAQEQAVKITREARRQATVNLEQQTRRAARIVGALGTALHEAGKQLRAENEELAANYYDMAGDRIDHLANTIERQDPEQLLASVQRLAQRQPILFVGAAVVISAVGVRALTNSSSRQRPQATGALQAGAQ
jgi:hypothetical protein